MFFRLLQSQFLRLRDTCGYRITFVPVTRVLVLDELFQLQTTLVGLAEARFVFKRIPLETPVLWVGLILVPFVAVGYPPYVYQVLLRWVLSSRRLI